MSINELEIKLRKNKIDLEHKSLLQEMNLGVASLVGFPLTWIALINFLGLNAIIGNSGSILVIVITIGVAIWFIEKTNRQLKEKQEEINNLLSDLAT